MRWSCLGPWVALCLATGCTSFVGVDTDTDAGPSESGTEPTTAGSTNGSTTAAATTTGLTTSPLTTGTTSPTSGTTSSPTSDGTTPSSTADGTTMRTAETGRDSDATESGSTGIAVACDNEVMDGNESDVDCGGSCDPCDLGQACDGGTDCTTGFCAPSFQCGFQEPTVWLDGSDPGTIFSEDTCSNGPPEAAQQVHCWTNKGSHGGFFVDDGGEPLYRPFENGIEFDNTTMMSEGDVFPGDLGDVAVFLVQRELSSRNSFDFNLNHPNQQDGRYSSHAPWGGASRRITFDVGGDDRVQLNPGGLMVGDTHAFGFVNSADDDVRLILVDGEQLASEVDAVSSDAGAVSVGNGNHVVLLEFRVYSPSPNTLQRQVIEGQLACRWDLRDQLPATHPFHDPDGASETGCPPSP